MPNRSRSLLPCVVPTAVALVGGLVIASSAPVAPALPITTPAIVPVAAKACAVDAKVKAKKPRQVVVVRSTGSKATIKACTRTSAGTYVISHGPYAGHVGRNGVGSKREGDGRMPSGLYRLRGGFGMHANPGVGFSWFKTDGRDRWVDDPQSAYYNLHTRTPVNGRWTSAEKLRIPSYAYAQVIGYNEARTPGKGSAIFLHVSNGRATAGCVSLKRSSLLKIMRWEKAGAYISIKRA